MAMSTEQNDLEHSQPAEMNKRKGDDLHAENVVRRRATRACLSCRGRKVRCDVTSEGTPCTNCRLDKVTCRLTASSRRRVPASTSGATGPRLTPGNTEISAETIVTEPAWRSQTAAPDFPIALTFEGSRESENAQRPSTSAEDGIISPRSIMVSPESTNYVPCYTSPKQKGQGIPVYIQPLSARLKPVDIEYISKKGALAIPDDELQAELIRKYVECVYAFMPTLDLRAFLSPIVRRDAGAAVSLLVFQAVMFAGSAFIDIDYITSRGYPDRRSMRKEFFERTRLLYDQDCEHDRISRLQALLLMTYWHEKADDEKETWYWTGIALSLAQVLGMHRNPDYLDITPELKRVRKRIWWSCFVRDRLLAIGIRRPARIRMEDFDVPMLTLDDIAMEPLDDDILRYLAHLPIADDHPTKKSMALCFLELIQLCTHIGDILSTQYSTLGNPARGPEENVTMMVMPRRSPKQEREMGRCDRNLEDWLENLNLACRYNSNPKEPSLSRRLLHLHQAQLYMIYLTAIEILHRPQALRSSSHSTETEINPSLSREHVTKAAARITQVVYDLQKGNQLRFASTSAIPALLSATLIHLIDIRYADQDSRYASIGRFYQCWQALQSLREIYASADYGVCFLEAVIQKTNIHIPMLSRYSFAASTEPSRKSGVPISQKVTNVAVELQDLDSMSQLVASSNPLMTPLTFPSGVVSSLSQSNTADATAVDLQDAWTGIDTEENLLQALINFDTSPTFYTTCTSGQ